MAKNARSRVQFRRRREGKTNFRYRLNMLRSGKPRAVVRKTLNKTIVQFIDFNEKGDQVVAQATSTDLKKLGYKGSLTNIPAAYLTGLLAGKRAKSNKVDGAVLDIGLNTPVKGSKMFASLRGILDAGVEVPHSEEILPGDDYVVKGIEQKDLDSIKSKIMEA